MLVHDILYLFLRRMKEEKRLPLTTQEPGYLETVLTEIAEKILKEFEQDKATGFGILWSLQKAEMIEDLKGWLKAELGEEGEFLPVYLELPFSCPFPIDGKEKLSLKGRVDRIDLTPEGRRAKIIDYKTGKHLYLEDGEFKGGEALQLPVYLYFATSSLLKNMEEVEADYYYVTRRGKYRKAPFTLKDWEGKLATLKKIVAGLVGGIRKGFFVPGLPSCIRCEYPWICGHAAAILYERKSRDPRSEFFERIKEIP